MNPAEWLVRAAQLTPDAPALMSGSDVVASYGEFGRRAAAIGAGLQADYGVQPGDRVALFMHNHTQYLEALYGIWTMGGVVVPINAKLHVKEAAWIIKDAGVRVAFVSDDFAADLKEVAPDCLNQIITADSPRFLALYEAQNLASPARFGTDDMIWLFYTSGTTGKPKGVMISAGNLLVMTLGYFTDVDQVSAKDAILYAAPMSHGAGIYNFVYVMKGARHVVPKSSGFDAQEILTLAPEIGNVGMFAAPTMVKRLVDAARKSGMDGTGIKTVIYGGGPMYVADIIEANEVMGARFVQIYGQGECPMGITSLSRDLVSDRRHQNWRARLGSVGRAQSAVRVQVADADGTELPVGQVGEIMVSGATLMLGYWNNPDATAKTIRSGWLLTGDMGALDQDGFLTLHDRSKDMIVSGGSNIYPREVEEVLLDHAAISEVAVVGQPHAEWGEQVVAFVVAKPGMAADFAALDAHCIQNIARFKRPKRYYAIDALPKNNYGKVLKTELRQKLEKETGK